MTTMRRIVLRAGAAFVLSASFAVVTALPAAAATPGTMGDGAPIYAEPSTSSAVVGHGGSGHRITLECKTVERVPAGSATYGRYMYRLTDYTNGVRGWGVAGQTRPSTLGEDVPRC
jgi:hypothetical protein